MEPIKKPTQDIVEFVLPGSRKRHSLPVCELIRPDRQYGQDHMQVLLDELTAMYGDGVELTAVYYG